MFRAHGGYGFQQDNNAAFFGFDKTIKLFDRDLMLRSDFIQIDDQRRTLAVERRGDHLATRIVH